MRQKKLKLVVLVSTYNDVASLHDITFGKHSYLARKCQQIANQKHLILKVYIGTGSNERLEGIILALGRFNMNQGISKLEQTNFKTISRFKSNLGMGLKYIAIMNDDLVVQEKYLESTVSHVSDRTHCNANVCGNKRLFSKNRRV